MDGGSFFISHPKGQIGFVGCHDTWFRYQCIIDFKSLNLIGFYMCTLLLT